ncbi:zinc finger, CCHC-type containing protein [Tanacetum coccineum]
MVTTRDYCCRDDVDGDTESSFQKYFPCFDQPFEEVVYLKGEINAVSIGKRDVDMLLRDTFVNDTITDFYIKYLKSKINPVDRLRFHFLNSFFFQKLADPDKEPLDACKRKEAFQCVKCILLGYRKGIVGNKLWRLDDITSKVVLYRNMGFNESGEYMKTFIGFGVGTGSMQVLQGVELEVEPQYDHTFEVEPYGNVDQNYREDGNEAAFAVVAVEKIYAHELLTFNNTVACEVIYKWKAGLKDDMDARSDVYVLSNGCKKCSDDNDGYYWEYTPGDCDVEKNGKWSCIYAVESHEYQMVCTRLDIASADVGMLDKFDRGLQTDVQVFVDFDYAMAAYMTLTGAWKKEIWLKGLLAESGYELSLVAGIATGALVKGGSRSEVPAQVEGAAYRY